MTIADSDISKYGLSTVAVHVGSEPDAHSGAVIPPISLSTTFKQERIGEFKYEYSRTNNPTRERFERCIAAMERGKHGLAFASGSATTATVLSMLAKDSHVLSINDVYGGTYRYFTRVATSMNITTDFISCDDTAEIEANIKPNTKLIWIESPTNPTLKIVDIRKIAEVAHKHDILLLVDNTFMSPIFQTPLELGADIVLHSVTKFINGHSDVVMGIAVTNSDEINEKLRFLQNSIGAIPSPFDCYLALRGVKTLSLRMHQHQKSALVIAAALEASEHVVKVIYPGLKSHPNHDIALSQMRGFGGMLSFQLKGDFSNVEKFFGNVKFFALAESLGGVESLIELPSRMTHGAVSAADREKLGITDTLIRVSVGVEDTEDLLADILNALEVSQI